MLHTDPTVDQIMQWSDSAPNAVDIEPLHANKKLKKSAGDFAKLREWVTETRENMLDPSRMRANAQIKNLALWIGLHYNSQNLNADFRSDDGDDISVDTHKVIINNIYDIERNRYSKISRNQPQTRVTPKSADYNDYVGSRVAQASLDTVKRRVKQRQKVNRMLRDSFIFGEAWIKTWWNKSGGWIDPRWERYADKLKPGQKKWVNIDGERIQIDLDNPMFVGDHGLKNILPWNLFIDPQVEPEDCEWVIIEDYIHVENAKRLYPNKANKIQSDNDGYKVLNTGSLVVETLRNHICRWTVFGRRTEFLPDGAYFVCTEDVMLEEPTDNPCEPCAESEWGDLPLERLTDIDVPGRLHGYSTINILSNLQHSENQMTTMMKHYLLMLGHPKMLIPFGADIAFDELSDGSFYVTYKGSTPPSMLSPNPIPPQVVAFADYLRDRMQKLGDLHGVSSGDIPNNVRAAKAIRLLQELEDLRATSIFSKYNDTYLALDRKLLLQMKNYRETDGRLISILGKGNEYLIEDFDVEVLSKEFQVELEISGMLPQQPSARAEFISEMYNLTQGQLFEKEKWVKLLGFEDEKEFIDHATVSVVKAQRENDKMMKGVKLESPQPHENHLVEIREHAIIMQSANFQRMPEKVKALFMSHVRTHEYLAFLHMQDNPMFGQMLLGTCPWFPLVFRLPRDTMAQMGSPGAVQQQPQGKNQRPVAGAKPPTAAPAAPAEEQPQMQ